jgi:hypothetical protein
MPLQPIVLRVFNSLQLSISLPSIRQSARQRRGPCTPQGTAL